jgi:Skp family chaperone for outer membrane proteins
MSFRNLALFSVAAFVAVAQAQEAPRFAFFVPGLIIENTAQGKRVFAEVQTLAKKLEDALRVKGEELQRMDQQLRSSSITEEARSRIQRDFEDGRVAFQRMQEDSRAQMQRVEQTAITQFQSEIGPIIEALAKEKKLHCVFQFKDEVLFWADEDWLKDFTEEIGKRYDAAFQKGAAAKPATK